MRIWNSIKVLVLGQSRKMGRRNSPREEKHHPMTLTIDQKQSLDGLIDIMLDKLSEVQK
jgi:hypothetical protein